MSEPPVTHFRASLEGNSLCGRWPPAQLSSVFAEVDCAECKWAVHAVYGKRDTAQAAAQALDDKREDEAADAKLELRENRERAKALGRESGLWQAIRAFALTNSPEDARTIDGYLQRAWDLARNFGYIDAQHVARREGMER